MAFVPHVHRRGSVNWNSVSDDKSLQATVLQPKIWLVCLEYSYVKENWSCCFLILFKAIWPRAIFPSFEQPVIGLWNSMLEGQCVAVGVWCQDRLLVLSVSLDKVTACLSASVCPDEEWEEFPSYEWWSKINPVLWEFWEYIFLEFSSKGPTCQLPKRLGMWSLGLLAMEM